MKLLDELAASYADLAERMRERSRDTTDAFEACCSRLRGTLRDFDRHIYRTLTKLGDIRPVTTGGMSWPRPGPHR